MLGTEFVSSKGKLTDQGSLEIVIQLVHKMEENADLSWSVGPKGSGIVRLCMYLFVGSFIGLFLIVGGLVALIATTFLGTREGMGVFFILAFITVFLAVREILEFQVLFWNEWVMQEFWTVGKLRWILLVTLLSGLVLVVAFLVVGDWLLFSGEILLAIIGYGGAHLLSSTGEIDPEMQTLTYEGRTSKLESLTDVKQVTLGQFTFLWLSFSSEAEQYGIQLYSNPTEVVEKASPLFKAEG